MRLWKTPVGVLLFAVSVQPVRTLHRGTSRILYKSGERPFPPVIDERGDGDGDCDGDEASLDRQ